jgi:hypothetical protein
MRRNQCGGTDKAASDSQKNLQKLQLDSQVLAIKVAKMSKNFI